MVEYVTREELLGIAKSRQSEGIRMQKSAESRSARDATFLSHSSKDDEIMPAVVFILESHGATVYLDKKDESLQTKRPKETATYLRDKISICKKFVLFASNNTKDSKWVPWELGLSDGYRRPGNVCIFPAPDKAYDKEWSEQEYFGIYDRIVWGKFTGNSESEWLVWNHSENTAVSLRKWLER